MMPRNPLYRASSLTLDYDEKRQVYVLKRISEDNGSVYRTDRQARSVVESIRKSIQCDIRFEGTNLEISQKAREKLGLEKVVN